MNKDNGRKIHHGLRFNQMETPGRFNSPSKSCDARSINETELGELKIVPDSTTKINHGVPCRDGACRINGTKDRPEHRLESPWHYLKTFFLITIIVAFVIWIIVYVLLSRYDVL